MDFTLEQIQQVIEEIQTQAEVDRRALAKRRVDIYRDGGKPFLIEKILREFGPDALAEMRVTPINLLKKIVDKRAAVYKRPPTRTCKIPNDQALVDYYVEELCLNQVMQKANRYLVLSSNTAAYVRPCEGEIKIDIVPSYLYSVIANPYDRTKIEAYIFSAFTQEGQVASQDSTPPATGQEGFSEERSFRYQGDLVASREKSSDQRAEQYIFWTDSVHFTTDSNGAKYADPSQGEEQFMNPIMDMPVVNIARDRDNETWATQGEDMVDLTMSIQMGWTDLMTIAKHQGFSILTIVSEEEPKKLQIGVNRAVWLKVNPQGPQPSISYVQGQSPLAQYKELLMELLALLLTTNNMDPGSIGGQKTTQQYTSGFHALLSMADSLEAIESDKPIMLDAEKEIWEKIVLWHNWMFDTNQLEPEARALGKFSDAFDVNIQFADIKPLESEDERIARVKGLMDMGLITRMDALKKLQPELTDEMAAAKLQAIDDEKAGNVAKAQALFAPAAPTEEPVIEPSETEGEPDPTEQGV